MLFFRKIKKKILQPDVDLKNKFLFLQIVGILGTLLWFVKFPTYRYGASYIIISLICLIITINMKKSFKILTKQFNNFIIIVFLIIIAKYISKYDNEKSFFPEISSFSEKINNTNVADKHLRKVYINNKFSHYTTDDRYLCMYSSSPCTNIPTDKSLNHKKKAGYNIFYLDSK